MRGVCETRRRVGLRGCSGRDIYYGRGIRPKPAERRDTFPRDFETRRARRARVRMDVTLRVSEAIGRDG